MILVKNPSPLTKLMITDLPEVKQELKKKQYSCRRKNNIAMIILREIKYGNGKGLSGRKECDGCRFKRLFGNNFSKNSSRYG